MTIRGIASTPDIDRDGESVRVNSVEGARTVATWDFDPGRPVGPCAMSLQPDGTVVAEVVVEDEGIKRAIRASGHRGFALAIGGTVAARDGATVYVDRPHVAVIPAVSQVNAACGEATVDDD